MTVADYLAAQLAESHRAYIERNPKSRIAYENSFAYLPGGNTRTVIHADPFPLTFASGEGSTLTSVDGHKYVDLLGEFSAGIFGHSNPRIANAITDAMTRGWNYGGTCTYEKELASKVCERFGPSGLQLVRFTNSGTEANTMAIATAQNVTGKKKILVFSSGYHGGTLVFPLAVMKGETVAPMNLPHDFVYAPYNNISETREILDHLPQDSLAAILVEPIQGSGGCRPADRRFLNFLRTEADERKALLIMDEVMASRLGYSGYSAEMNIRADIMTLGKYLGGGMTIGAFGGRRDIMELFDPTKSKLFHPGTYNNNVFSMAAGITGLDIYDASEVDRLNNLGEKLKTDIQAILMNHGLYPDSYRSPAAGLMEIDSLLTGTEGYIDDHSDKLIQLPSMFVTGRGTASQWQALFYHHMLERNINIAVRGYTPLHLQVSASDCKAYVESIEAFVIKHKAMLTS
ncbi:acetylornithine aminotransferase, putative [Talaromyces stipitatus ATCC 10500]|uniref:Acetylornithine aminotransferase, putative n=1 Tax=Talaromyces stipitatus (strain ATCC 10500 / CBS 375.48 / QM 6759 / NRRL 1006) TaxID=441959 RepID=B8MF32_TALSN|nr:acetylornithine aminotransferase, putative [Talaromyces stipitatus ATCC 10500]EED16131.1 acetylornithine aminotransferase, putative [Talaromyces stipitatus ATCC 10500]